MWHLPPKSGLKLGLCFVFSWVMVFFSTKTVLFFVGLILVVVIPLSWWIGAAGFLDWKQGQEIRQIFINEGFSRSFMDIILGNTQLVAYHNSSEPAFFYGLLTEKSFEILKNHKSLAVIIFTGMDASIRLHSYKVSRIFSLVREHPDRYKCVAISTFIEQSLQRAGLRYHKFPFFPIELSKFHAVPKGKGIYVYGLPDIVYHNDVVINEIMPRFPDIPFLFVAHMGTQRFKLPKPYQHYQRRTLLKRIYPSCFLAIRLTEHDGLAGSVQELGAMGIRSVWNGGTPSAISYKNVEDVIRIIKEERKTIGTIDHALSQRVKQFLTIPKKFYHVATYVADTD